MMKTFGRRAYLIGGRREGSSLIGFGSLEAASPAASPFFRFVPSFSATSETSRECHGSIHHLQCTRPCTRAIWSAEGLTIDIDMERFRAREPLPRCPRCGAMARPNILMFGDWSWVEDRTEAVARDGAVLIRINPREHHVPPGHISIPLGGLEGIERILRRAEEG